MLRRCLAEPWTHAPRTVGSQTPSRLLLCGVSGWGWGVGLRAGLEPTRAFRQVTSSLSFPSYKNGVNNWSHFRVSWVLNKIIHMQCLVYSKCLYLLANINIVIFQWLWVESHTILLWTTKKEISVIILQCDSFDSFIDVKIWRNVSYHQWYMVLWLSLTL